MLQTCKSFTQFLFFIYFHSNSAYQDRTGMEEGGGHWANQICIRHRLAPSSAHKIATVDTRLEHQTRRSIWIGQQGLRLDSAIYCPDSFVLMLRYCANLRAIKYKSTNLNRIVADKSHLVIVAKGKRGIYQARPF